MVSTRGQRRLAGDAASPMQTLTNSRTNGNASIDSKEKASSSGSSQSMRKTRVPKTRKIEKEPQSENPEPSLSATTVSFKDFTFALNLPVEAKGKASVTVSFAPADEPPDPTCVAEDITTPATSETSKTFRKLVFEDTSGLVPRLSSPASKETKFALLHLWSPFNESEVGGKIGLQRPPNSALLVPLKALEKFLMSLAQDKKLINFPVSDTPSKRKRNDEALMNERTSKRTKNTQPVSNVQENTQRENHQIDSAKMEHTPRYRIATTGGYTKEGALIIPGQRVEIWGSDDEETERAAASRRKAESKTRAASVLKNYRAKQAAKATNPRNSNESSGSANKASKANRNITVGAGPNRSSDANGATARAQSVSPVPQTPETSRRAWGLGSFVPTIPHSVTRFVPTISLFSRPQGIEPLTTTSQRASVHSQTVRDTPFNENEAVSRLQTSPLSQNNASVDGGTRAIGNAHVADNDSAAQLPDAIDGGDRETFVASPGTTVNGMQVYIRNETASKEMPNNMDDMPLMRRARQAKAAEEKKLFGSQEHLIKLEVDRQVREALEQHKLVAKWQTEKAEKAAIAAEAAKAAECVKIIQTDRKRKRRPSSPQEIPNPEGSSYGMNLDFFCYSSEEDDSEEDEINESILMDRGSPSSRPAKRSRLSHGILTPTKQVVGDPHQATPYTGRLFADPQTNIFMEDASPAIDLEKPTQIGNNPSGQFQVPYSSESDGEGRHNIENPRTSSASTESSTAVILDQFSHSKHSEPRPATQSLLSPVAIGTQVQNTSTQFPPPPPTPAHAALPSTNALSQIDALAQARAQATRYAPKQPSGLRAASRLSTSTVASNSDMGDEAEPTANASIDTAVAQDPSTLSHTSRNRILGISEVDAKVQEIIEAESHDFEMPNFDPVVRQALAALRDEDIIPISFTSNPAPSYGFDIDPVVAAALDAHWGPADDAKAAAAFEAGMAHFKASKSSSLLT